MHHSVPYSRYFSKDLNANIGLIYCLSGSAVECGVLPCDFSSHLQHLSSTCIHSENKFLVFVVFLYSCSDFISCVQVSIFSMYPCVTSTTICSPLSLSACLQLHLICNPALFNGFCQFILPFMLRSCPSVSGLDSVSVVS